MKLSRPNWILIFALTVLILLIRFYNEMIVVQSEPMSSWQVGARGDCAIVLTGGGGRIREGFDLLANLNVKKLIISGVYANAQLREIMPLWPFYGNLNEKDVILERRSETTYGNAIQSLTLVEALKCQKIVLVTSRLHMYRAYRTFRSIFPPNLTLIKQPVVSGRYIPSGDELFLESLKSIFYSLWAY